MKKNLTTSIMILLLILGSANSTDYVSVVKNPTSFFREMSRVLLQTSIDWGDPAVDENQLIANTSKFLQLNEAIRKQNQLNNSFGKEVTNIVAENSVLNGHELHLLGKILSATHALSARSLTYSSLYNLENQESGEKILIESSLSQTKRNLIWLSTHVTLFGIYTDGHRYYYQDGAIRRIVKDIIKSDGKKNTKLNELASMVAHTTSKKNRKLLREYLVNYNKEKTKILKMAAGDKQIKALVETIESNPISKDLVSQRKLSFKKHSFIDGFMSFLGKSMNIVSAFFGNSVGAIKWRKGHLYGNKPTHHKLSASLKPLDIIFEKTPFALTDTFIPGNFGHAALYIGTEAQIKELGMWNHPDVIPHHANLLKGHVIVEALRPGVRSTSLAEWMNVDEILVLRHATILKKNKDEIFRMYSRIMRQIGKKYDFNFDVTTTDKVVCSELVYHAFGKINWPTKYIMGRATITPDDVAQVVLYKDSPINFDTYIFSTEKGTIQNLNIVALAKKLGFKKNEKRSTAKKPSFDRIVRKCRQVRRTRLRQGSHRDKHRLISVCKTEYKELDYKSLERKYSIDKRHTKDGNH